MTKAEKKRLKKEKKQRKKAMKEREKLGLMPVDPGFEVAPPQ